MITPTIRLVHSDARGEIYSIAIGDRELMLLHSRAGTLRGGHSHDVPETVMVLTGKLRYRKLHADGVETVDLQDGGVSFNPAYEPHLGEFPEDSWILEWKVCKDKTAWKNTDYEPWRKKVVAHAG